MGRCRCGLGAGCCVVDLHHAPRAVEADRVGGRGGVLDHDRAVDRNLSSVVYGCAVLLSRRSVIAVGLVAVGLGFSLRVLAQTTGLKHPAPPPAAPSSATLPPWLSILTGDFIQGITVAGFLVAALWWMAGQYKASEGARDLERAQAVDDLRAQLTEAKTRADAEAKAADALRAQLTDALATAARVEGERDVIALERDRLKIELVRHRGTRGAGGVE